MVKPFNVKHTFWIQSKRIQLSALLQNTYHCIVINNNINSRNPFHTNQHLSVCKIVFVVSKYLLFTHITYTNKQQSHIHSVIHSNSLLSVINAQLSSVLTSFMFYRPTQCVVFVLHIVIGNCSNAGVFVFGCLRIVYTPDTNANIRHTMCLFDG